MKVLVTGGAGFIGSHLVEALVRHRHRVRVLDDLSSGTLDNLRAVLSKVEFIRADLRDSKVLHKAIREVEVVFHQAALRSVPKSVKDPLPYHEVNVTGTFNLLELCLKEKVRRVVFASSSSVYGEGPLPQREKMIPNPQSPYAASKLAGEIYCTTFARLYGLQTVCLRYFNVFGPRQSLENEYAVVIPKFITCLLQGNPPPIHGDGFQTRDFTYIDNVVQANLKAAIAPKASGEVLNIAAGKGTSIRELAQAVGEELGFKVKPRFIEPRPGDVRHTLADISKAKRLLGYRVEVPFREGLARTVAWFRRQQRFGEQRVGQPRVGQPRVGGYPLRSKRSPFSLSAS